MIDEIMFLQKSLKKFLPKFERHETKKREKIHSNWI